MTANKRIKQGVMYAILILLSIYTLFPIYFLIVNSFKSQKEIVGSPISVPSSFDFSYLKNAAAQIRLGESVVNTLIITVVAVALIVVISSLTAWMMVRNKTKASSFLFLCFTAAMLIPFQSVMYPLVNLMEALGLKNTFGLILMYGGFGLSMTVFLYHGFFKSVPLSLEEAAVIDGANIFQLFFNVVFPLVKPITATVVITNAMWIWNDYLLPYLVIGSEYKTISVAIQYLRGGYGSIDLGLMMAMLVLAIIPIVIFYMVCQKWIIQGVIAGAVKG